MMKTLFPLLFTVLFLCGCAAHNPPPETTAATDIPAILPTEASPDYPQTANDGITQRWMMPEDVTGFLPMEENLILFSGAEATTLRLLNTQTMAETACYETAFPLMAENFTLRLWDGGISYFDPAALETVVLDPQFQELSRIPAPEDLLGMPLLSSDGQTLYYCTSDAIRALDLGSGISRVLKEASYPVQGLSGLLLGDTVLQISITEASGQWRTLFLSTKTGQLLQSHDGNINPVTFGTTYMASTQEGSLQSVLYGRTDGPAMVLHPRDWGHLFFLKDRFQMVSVVPEMGYATLDLYNLETARRTASLKLPEESTPRSVTQTSDGRIWILTSQELILWDWSASPVEDSTLYGNPCFSRQAPDYDGLAACSLYAQEIGEKYGVEIRIYQDAISQKPWDYDLESEYQVPVLRRELELLDQRLGSFPEGFLSKLAERFTALRICLVRSAVGSPASGSLAAVNGIQFLDGSDAYIVLSTDHDTQYALYHELCHLIDTVVLTESTAYDRWDTLNPVGFQYDNDYLSNRTRDAGSWLEEGKGYFVDTYAMSFAKEDRARIWEYAMTEGHELLFSSPYLQAKLRLLCTGIREAFDLKDETGPFAWEQYLLHN